MPRPPHTQTVTGPRGTARLTNAQHAILATLSKHPPGSLLPLADVIPPPVRGAPDWTHRRRAFRVLLYNLRERLRDIGFPPDAIETVPSVGVRLTCAIR